jgi:hypothetical protein
MGVTTMIVYGIGRHYLDEPKETLLAPGTLVGGEERTWPTGVALLQVGVRETAPVRDSGQLTDGVGPLVEERTAGAEDTIVVDKEHRRQGTDDE